MFTLNLVTPEKKLVAGEEIEEVFVPGYLGELNILPGHAPLLTTLSTGVLRYRLKGEQTMHAVAISSGYAQVNPQGVTVLAQTAERPEEIDLERVSLSRSKAEAALVSTDVTPESMVKLQRKLARAAARQAAAQTSQTKH